MPVEELRSYTRLDELLTVLAQAAVQSADRRWAERYDEVSPQLDSALAEIVALAAPSRRSLP